MSGTIILETARLVLRRMGTDDAAFMLGLLNDPTWLRGIGDRGVRTLDDARRYIESGPMAAYARCGFGSYVVELKATRGAVGICGLMQRDYLEDVDIGYALLPQHCGQGYAREAAAAVLDYAKDVLGLPRVVATTRLDNAASARLLAKLGMRFERLLLHPDGDRELRLFVTAPRADMGAAQAAPL